MYIGASPDGTQPALLWTENETNMRRLYDIEHYTKYVKDAFHRYDIIYCNMK